MNLARTWSGRGRQVTVVSKAGAEEGRQNQGDDDDMDIRLPRKSWWLRLQKRKWLLQSKVSNDLMLGLERDSYLTVRRRPWLTDCEDNKDGGRTCRISPRHIHAAPARQNKSPKTKYGDKKQSFCSILRSDTTDSIKDKSHWTSHQQNNNNHQHQPKSLSTQAILARTEQSFLFHLLRALSNLCEEECIFLMEERKSWQKSGKFGTCHGKEGRESANWHCYHYERQINNNNNNKHDTSKHENYDSTPTVKDRSRIQRRAREEEPDPSPSPQSRKDKQAVNAAICCLVLSEMNKRQRQWYSTTIIKQHHAITNPPPPSTSTSFGSEGSGI